MQESERRFLERQEIERQIEAGNSEFINQFFSCDLSVEQVVERYNAGERDFSDVGLCSLDLSGINLARANLTGAKLVGTNLSNTSLVGASLSISTAMIGVLLVISDIL